MLANFIAITGDQNCLRECARDRRFCAIDLQAKPRKLLSPNDRPTPPPRRLSLAEIDAILAPAQEGLKALLYGVATSQQWETVRLAVARAESLAAAGIERGMAGHFRDARLALDAARLRVLAGFEGAAWGSGTRLHFDEIQAVNDALDLHACQLTAARRAQVDVVDAANAPSALAAAHALVRPAPPAPVQERLL